MYNIIFSNAHHNGNDYTVIKLYAVLRTLKHNTL